MTSLSSAQALLVVIASRLMLIAVDLVLAMLAFMIRNRVASISPSAG